MDERIIGFVISFAIVVAALCLMPSVDNDITESLPDYDSMSPHKMQLVDKSVGHRGMQGYTVYDFVFSNGTSAIGYSESDMHYGADNYANMRIGENYTVYVDKYGHALEVE